MPSIEEGSCPAQSAQMAKAFLQAAEDGEVAAVSRLLRQGVDVNVRDDVEISERYNAGWTAGKTALIRAAQQGHIETTRVLLAAGADVEARDDDYWTALMWAANNGHAAVVRQLLAAGASVKARDHEKRTPLTYAAVKGDPEVVRLLLGAGARAATPDRFDKTALMLSLEHKHSDVARLLEQAEREQGRAAALAAAGAADPSVEELRRERDGALARCKELEAEVAALRQQLAAAK